MKRFFLVFLTLLLVLSAASCGAGVANRVYDPADMEGMEVGVLSDTASAGYVQRFIGSLNVRYYESADAMAADLRAGVIDCAVADEDTAGSMTGLTSGLRTLGTPYVDEEYALALSVENRLMLSNLKDALSAVSGQISRIVSGWESGGYEGEYEFDSDDPVVTVGVQPDFYPYAFYDEEGELKGIEIDVALAVCEYLGLRPEFAAVEPGMLLYMTESGKTSFSIGRLSPDASNTDLAFTQGYMHSVQLVVVRK